MTLSLTAVTAPKVGFASHQNAVPVLRELTIHGSDERSLDDLTLRLEADPPFLKARSWRIDRLAANDTLQIADRDVALSATVLSGLSESISGTVTLTLTASDGMVLSSAEHPIELLARNHWGGVTTMAELLPAFVMPNDPAVDRILNAASDVLRRAGRSDEIDGYQSGKRERVWEIASAIWSAVAGLQLSYALPPASFEQVGQKVRTPGAITDSRVATCLDTALLFAAALEQAGLNPILVLTAGHAFVGFWLQPVEFATLIVDEAAALRRRVDLDDLLVFETTSVTHKPPASFDQAIAQGKRQIAEGAPAAFEMAIDVRRARMQRIRPLGVSVTSHDHVEAAPTVVEAMAAAPSLPAFDVEVNTAGLGPQDRIKIWQRKLLNLTTSNRLLHLGDSAKALHLLCPDPGALEDLLAAGRKVRVVPMPDLGVGGRDEALYDSQSQASLREEVARAATSRGEALSLLPKDKLDAALVDLYRKARTDIEEGGANTLYLALGFLKWKKSPTEARSYRAPLILLPVTLERKSALSGVAMVHHEDEARFNLTLLELLRQDFEVDIPGLDAELPKDASGVDVAAVWRTVRTAVREMPGFEVIPDVVLGTFSFAKYLMWKDLVDRADRLLESPLVRHLIERDGTAFEAREGFPRADELDTKVDPAELFAPLAADSSQLAAVVASGARHSFVLDGPPGTGKSQTIANMIAHNMALGRRVLFVAEKKAALDVVQRRLADQGLAPFCLELHSAKAMKVEVLKQLDRAWTTRDTLTPEEWMREAADAKRLRGALNDVVELLHRVEPNGWTIHRAIGRVVRDATAMTPRFNFAADARHDAASMAAMVEAARRLGLARADVALLPAALDAVVQTQWSNGWQEAIVASARALPGTLDALLAARDDLRAATGLSVVADDPAGLRRLAAFVGLLLTAHGHDLRLAFAPDMVAHVAEVRRVLSLIVRYHAEAAALSSDYAPEAARRIDVAAIQAAWKKAGTKVWIFRSRAERKVAAALAEAGGATAPVDVAADLPRLAALNALLGEIDAAAPRLSAFGRWSGIATDVAAVEQQCALAEQLRAAVATHADGAGDLAALRTATAELIVDANELLAPEGAIAGKLARLVASLTQFERVAAEFDALSAASPGAEFGTLRARAAAVTEHVAHLNAWTYWQRARHLAVDAGLLPLVDAVAEGLVAPEATVPAFEVGYARWFAAARIDAEPRLRQFAAREQGDLIERFRAIDDRLAALTVRYIRARICGLIPAKEQVGKRDGYAVLKHQLQLQRAHMPVRKLAGEMGDAFTRLAPCMLMSPLSIAQYLPPDQALFDLVIFDEASQITPWDAIGAMARGRQVVIAGDPRQMPPTNFFQRGVTAADDGATEADMESILDECLGAGVPQHSLDWHYRSRHESLITFSNHNYYDGKLVTFPAPVTRASAVSWRKVDGVYARGSGRTNPIEAQAIVDAAVVRLRSPDFVDARGIPLTLAIITLNAEQQRLVEDLLDKARRSFPEIEPHFGSDRTEPVVVKNLETVQGDERDLILLGIGFGPTEPGGKTMAMNFGALNNQGGWRRLNVAATRARSEMIVFTSFEPGMIDLTRSSARAVADLKHFIEFAERGPRALAEAASGSLGGAESPFEEAVARELQRRGWVVVPQVGVSKFRIDLGIVHPDRPGDYLLGVECDGATYHSAATARDRDKVRAAILGNLGWHLVRIWSTDWWIDKQGAADRLHHAIDTYLAADREAVAARAAIPVATASPAEAIISMSLPVEAQGAEPSVAILADDVQSTAEDANDADGSATPSLQFARLAQPVVPTPPSQSAYIMTDFTGFAEMIDPAAFYDATYDPILLRLIDHILACEAPIAETLFVQRLARAHGFQRAGRVIRDRVISLAAKHAFIASDGGEEPFIWIDEASSLTWSTARFPQQEGAIRQFEQVALPEIRAAGPPDAAIDIARRFGVRRLTVAAHNRIMAAHRDTGRTTQG